jgi:glucokinase
MGQTIGALVTEHIAVGVVENGKLVGRILRFPDNENAAEVLEGMPAEEIVEHIGQQIESAGRELNIEAVGVGFPGINRDGLIEDSPNLKQTKGLNAGKVLARVLAQKGIAAPVYILNDADALAAGIAATRGQLDKIVRVWFLGVGIGFGRYPEVNSYSEGGHTVVTLDPKETYCGCGGTGHLEGIMGHRSMRLRFMDLEPEEVFVKAQANDPRCSEFVKLWHRALAAATASSVHMEGPGRFFISGPSAGYVQANLLDQYLHEMVKMSPLQGSAFEVVPTSDVTALIGAAVTAERAAQL